VVAGIPWLRAGRDDVRERAVAALDAGDPEGAAVVLLADADDWWDAPPPPDAQLRAALAAPTLRDAVDLLGFGRVGTYFVHRWSDPSWLAVLALTAAHPPAGRPVVDLACGAGHLLRHLALHGHRDLTGVDVVFAKLWLARRFVLPAAVPVALVCADLTTPWPLPPPTRSRHVACHDALYFLDGKEAFVAAARRHAGDGGAVLLGHCHNALHPAGRAGRPLDPDGWRALLPGAAAYAEEELTAAAATARLPDPADDAALAASEAVNLALDEAGGPPEPALLAPAPGAALSRNPLYADGARRWPGDRWAAEYGPRAETYLPERWTDLPPDDAVHRRLVLDLPEAW
jgi:SAM-dependent methyltransferase